MNEFLLIDAVGCLDEELLADHLERKWEIRNKVKKDWSIKRWSTIAASFVVVSASVLLYYRFAPKPEIPSTDPKPSIDQTEATPVEPPNVQTDPPDQVHGSIASVIFNSKVYYLEETLSKAEIEENLGEMLGQVSLGTVYAYIPDDNETNRIIIKHNDGFTVFAFDTYYYDGADNWLANLLGNAVSIEVRDTEPKYDTDKQTVYAKLTEIDDVIALLSELKVKSTKQELNKYYYDKFSARLEKGKIRINEDGNIAYGSNLAVWEEFSALVNGQSRRIVVIMEDNTKLSYTYLEGAGVLKCGEFGCILTEEQIEEINEMIGLR